MRVGSVVLSTHQGLGYLAKAFYDNGIVTHPVVLLHTSRKNHPEWFPDAPVVSVSRDAIKYLKLNDVNLFFETPFCWEAMRVRPCAFMPMHECTPEVLPGEPTLFINPSALEQSIWPEGVHIPVPVDVRWRQRRRVHTYVHNAGNLGINGRNGTMEVIHAWEHFVQSPAKLLVRTQEPLGYGLDNTSRCYRGRTLEVRTGTVPFGELYSEGEAFIFPEKFNGLSLPLQEARASGMLVIATDRFPVNTWLPQSCLVPPHGYTDDRIAKYLRPFQRAEVDPRDIARVVDATFTVDAAAYSNAGREWAQQHSWEALKPRYMEALRQCASST